MYLVRVVSAGTAKDNQNPSAHQKWLANCSLCGDVSADLKIMCFGDSEFPSVVDPVLMTRRSVCPLSSFLDTSRTDDAMAWGSCELEVDGGWQ